MSSFQDPPRLTDAGSDGPDLLRSLLQNAQRDAPSAATSAALARRVAHLAATGAGAGGSAGAASALLGLKTMAVIVAGGVAVVAAAWFARPGPQASVPGESGQQVEAAAAAAESAAAANAPAEVASTDVAAPSEPAPTPAPHGPSAAAHPGAGRDAPASTASASADDFEADVALMQRAQDALRSSPASALALTAEHARRFPRSKLHQEREVITIEALLRSGQGAQARARADRFARQFPRSPHRRRLETLLGTGALGAPSAAPTAH